MASAQAGERTLTSFSTPAALRKRALKLKMVGSVSSNLSVHSMAFSMLRISSLRGGRARAVVSQVAVAAATWPG